MAYTLIDEKRNIWGCRLGDLSFDTAKEYLEIYGETRTLKDLNAYVEIETGRIILNMDNSRYMQNVFDAIAFLEADKAKRDAMIECKPENEKFLRCMRKALAIREALYFKRITKNYPVWDDNYEPNEVVIDHLVKSNPRAFYALYEYGFIQGKRAERARKKNESSKDSQRGELE